MVPGESIVRRCPSCEGSIRQRTLASGNTFGARFWTSTITAQNAVGYFGHCGYPIAAQPS